MRSCLAEEDLMIYNLILKITKFGQSILLYCKSQYAIQRDERFEMLMEKIEEIIK